MKSSEELSVRELTEQINRGITKAIRYNEVSKMTFIKSRITLFYSSYIRHKFSLLLGNSLDPDKFYEMTSRLRADAFALRLNRWMNEFERIEGMYKSNWIRSR